MNLSKNIDSAHLIELVTQKTKGDLIIHKILWLTLKCFNSMNNLFRLKALNHFIYHIRNCRCLLSHEFCIQFFHYFVKSYHDLFLQQDIIFKKLWHSIDSVHKQMNESKSHLFQTVHTINNWNAIIFIVV